MSGPGSDGIEPLAKRPQLRSESSHGNDRETCSGKVEGRETRGVQVFRGIPYARPPVGPLRFRAPEPAEPWSGLRAALEFGPSAPQQPMMLPLPGMDVGAMDEDCLYLNIYTPAADAAASRSSASLRGA